VTSVAARPTDAPPVTFWRERAIVSSLSSSESPTIGIVTVFGAASLSAQVTVVPLNV
jgi:hypothetical protein